MTDRGNWRALFNRYVRLATAVLGMSLAFGSIVFFFENDYGRIVAIAAGLLLFLVGFWYSDNPFLTSQRQYVALRAATQELVELVPRLNRAAVAAVSAAPPPGAVEELERVKAAMHDAVERMAKVAGKEGTPPAL